MDSERQGEGRESCIYQHEKQLQYTTAKQWYQNEKIRNSSQKGVEKVQ